jgi:hypothetical protein
MESLREATGNGKPAAAPTDRITPAAPDPFDPDKLRLSQDYGATLGVKRLLTSVPCRKPHKSEFVRVRPGEEWRLVTSAYEDKTNRSETFLVDQSLAYEFPGEIFLVCLFVAITRQNNLLLWPVKLPGPDGRPNRWHETAMAAARAAESKWVRFSANMSAGEYDIYEAVGNLSDPVWPELLFREILRLAFKDRFIQSHDHPVLRSLRGEA